jgi:hypothetical protein
VFAAVFGYSFEFQIEEGEAQRSASGHYTRDTALRNDISRSMTGKNRAIHAVTSGIVKSVDRVALAWPISPHRFPG